MPVIEDDRIDDILEHLIPINANDRILEAINLIKDMQLEIKILQRQVEEMIHAQN